MLGCVKQALSLWGVLEILPFSGALWVSKEPLRFCYQLNLSLNWSSLCSSVLFQYGSCSVTSALLVVARWLALGIEWLRT
jgi:hypothetical protein